MNGFFSKKETESISRPDGKVYSCASCGLMKGCKTPRVKPYGQGKKGIVIVNTIPSKVDDLRGQAWQDSVGKFLVQCLQCYGIDLEEDCVTVQAIGCYSDKVIGSYEIACCRKYVLRQLQDRSPKLIILLGQGPLESVIGRRWKKDLTSIVKWNGWVIPDQDLKAWVVPMIHPSSVDTASKEVKTIWFKDLENGLSYLDKPFPCWKKPEIISLTDLTPLNSIQNGLISIDFETTGIKPHAPGHRIICASVADTPDHCYAFMIPKSRKEQKPFLDLLENENIGKMAHNMKFEHTWAENRLRTEIKNWQWDSMLASHVIDNRPGITGLKFQTYINFGVVDYSSEVSPYFSSGTGKANGINQIHKLVNTHGGETQLLEYCGLDTIYQYRLALKQMKILGYENNS